VDLRDRNGGCILMKASICMQGWVEYGIRRAEEAFSQMLMSELKDRSSEIRGWDTRRVEEAFSRLHPKECWDGLRMVRRKHPHKCLCQTGGSSQEEKPEDGIRRAEEAFSQMYPSEGRVEGVGNRMGGSSRRNASVGMKGWVGREERILNIWEKSAKHSSECFLCNGMHSRVRVTL
jgi:hypothetical protein